MTVLEHTGPYPTRPRDERSGTTPLPWDPEPYRALGQDRTPDAALWRHLYRHLVLGRRFNLQATALAREGHLPAYASSTGQEACQVAAALTLAERDWLFPGHRDTLAAVIRGLDPVQALSLMRGAWHAVHDLRRHRIAPLRAPLATHLPHAVGLARAARHKGDGVAALAMVGGDATVVGAFHEAVHLAGVWQAPVVFLVQHDQFARSTGFAHQATGHGVAGRLVDGNDAPAVHEVLTGALARARSGGGPTVVEALTCHAGRPAHAAADDQAVDPVLMVERELRRHGLLTDQAAQDAADAAGRMAARMRESRPVDPLLDPDDPSVGDAAADVTEPLGQNVGDAARRAAES